MVGQTPMLGLGGIHPSAGEQELDRDVVGDASPQLHRTGIRQNAHLDFRQREFCVLFHDDDVGAQNHFEAAAAGDPVDGGDDGFIEIPGMVQTSEAAHTPVLVGFLAAAAALRSSPVKRNGRRRR